MKFGPDCGAAAAVGFLLHSLGTSLYFQFLCVLCVAVL
jgi:hypothetical protein